MLSKKKVKGSAPDSPQSSGAKQTNLFAFMKRAPVSGIASIIVPTDALFYSYQSQDSSTSPEAASIAEASVPKAISSKYALPPHFITHYIRLIVHNLCRNDATSVDDSNKHAKSTLKESQDKASTMGHSTTAPHTKAAHSKSRMDVDDDDGPVLTSRRGSSSAKGASEQVTEKASQSSSKGSAKSSPARRRGGKAPSKSRGRKSTAVVDSESDEEFMVSEDEDISVSSDSDVEDISSEEEPSTLKRKGKSASTQGTKRMRVQKATPSNTSSPARSVSARTSSTISAPTSAVSSATSTPARPPHRAASSAHAPIVPSVEIVKPPKPEAVDLPPPLVTKLRLPKGTSNVLDGETIVVTGIFETLMRDTMKSFIEGHGGKCTSAISGKTTMLVYGLMLENGKEYTEGSKYRAAIAQNEKVDPQGKGRARTTPIKLLSEEDFLQYLDDRLPPSQRRPPPPSNSIEISAPEVSLSLPSPTESPVSSSSAATSSAATATAMPETISKRKVPVSATDRLWTDLYKPRSLEEVVGNHPQLQALDSWLRNWESTHAGSTGSTPAAKGRGYGGGGSGSRAVLLSGPPGIGKTSTATLIAERYGYSVMELNASDVRAMRTLREILPTATTSTVASFDTLRAMHQNALEGRAVKSGRGMKRLLIMDEVDGMSSGDRGGNAEFIKYIKASKIPIIAICNNRQDPKMQTLSNYCLDLKFTRPATEAIVNRMMQICKVENMHAEKEALAMIVESCGGDLRQVLNTLQMWKTGPQKGAGDSTRPMDITVANVRERLESMNKDSILRLDGYSATSRMFTSTIGANPASLETRQNYFFVDYDIVPLLVQQCIPDAITKPPAPEDPAKAIQRLSAALDCAADADVFSEAVRSRQSWALLPSMGMSLVQATTIARTPNPSSPFIPMWFSKISSRNKRARLLATLCLHASGKFSGTRSALRLDYFDPLRSHLISPMMEASDGARDTKEAVSTSIERLIDYGLSNTDLMESMMEIAFPPTSGKGANTNGNIVIPDYSKVLETKVKTAFTREYNKRGNPSQSLGSVSAGLVNSMAGVIKRTSAATLIEEDEDDALSEEEDVKKEEDDLSAFKVKDKRKAPAAKKAATKKSAISVDSD